MFHVQFHSKTYKIKIKQFKANKPRLIHDLNLY